MTGMVNASCYMYVSNESLLQSAQIQMLGAIWWRVENIQRLENTQNLCQVRFSP